MLSHPPKEEGRLHWKKERRGDTTLKGRPSGNPNTVRSEAIIPGHLRDCTDIRRGHMSLTWSWKRNCQDRCPGISGALGGRGALGRKLYYALFRARIRGQRDKQESIGVTIS
ncbi:PREDICTED: uncharacterized protein LOC105150864 [Acromyrmex echinatior]|uniref:uncharacterized protein LOC105150864 n=1 Tax=Acromyrmex echinatior TaxID=103372 RepID=UPI000580D356|nr:PREDICTED: uncharacterized protein LOC105150864 [Acromyrmex echinatior]